MSAVDGMSTNHSISQQEHQTDSHDELVHRLRACGILLHEEVYRHRKRDYIYACVFLLEHAGTEGYGARTVHHHSDKEREDCVECKRFAHSECSYHVAAASQVEMRTR